MIDATMFPILTGNKINVYVGQALQKLAINVYVMEFKLVKPVVYAPINLILNG